MKKSGERVAMRDARGGEKSSADPKAESSDRTEVVTMEKEEEEEEEDEGKTGNEANPELRRIVWTREIASTKSRDISIRVNLTEFAIYVIYLTFLCVAVLLRTTNARFYHSNALSALFVRNSFSTGEASITFEKISTKGEFFKYAEKVMTEGFFWDFWYSHEDRVRPTEEDEKNVLYENRMLGRPRLRQVRVRNDSCYVPPAYRRKYRSCYDYYSRSTEDRRPFGDESEAFTYKSAEELQSGSYTGWIGTYGGGGYARVIPRKREEAVEAIDELKRGLWIDRGTRAVFVDFSVYNPNIDMFCVSKLLVEFPPQGSAIPSWSIRAIKFPRFREWTDYLAVACEVGIAATTVWFVLCDVQDLYYFRWVFFRKFSKWLDATANVLRVLYLVLSAWCYFEMKASLKRSTELEQEYASFDQLVWLSYSFYNVQAVLLFVSWLILIEYLRMTDAISRLRATLRRCLPDLLGFLIIFVTVLWAFAQVAHVSFGERLEEFRTWDIASFTLIRILLGDYDFHDVISIGRAQPTLFLLAYIFVVYFVLTSMFLAIIVNAYAQSKYDVSDRGSGVEFFELVRRGWRKLLGCCRRNGESGRESKKDTGIHGLSFAEMRNVLASHNFSQDEIDRFFGKYNVTSHTVLTEFALKDMLKELEHSPVGFDQTSSGAPTLRMEHSGLQERLKDIEGKIDRMDGRIADFLRQLR